MACRCRIVPDIRAATDADGAVLLNVATGAVFSLNEVGGRIWAMIEKGLPRERILVSLAAEFDVPEEQLENDLNLFLEQLESKGLVRNITEPALACSVGK
jgi:hypothetical protein